MGKPTPDSEQRDALLEWLTADQRRTNSEAIAHFWPAADGPEVRRLRNLVKQWKFQAKSKQPPDLDDISEGEPAPPPPPPPPKLRLVPSGRPQRPAEPPPAPPPPQVAGTPPASPPRAPPIEAEESILDPLPLDELGRESFLCETIRQLTRFVKRKFDFPGYGAAVVAASGQRTKLHAELMEIREQQRKQAAASGLTSEGRRAELARLARGMSTGDLEAITAEYLARVGGRVVAADLESTG